MCPIHVALDEILCRYIVHVQYVYFDEYVKPLLTNINFTSGGLRSVIFVDLVSSAQS